jgi:hypothetical protein
MSLLRLENISLLAQTNLTVTWQSVSNRTYELLMATGNLAAVFSPVATNIAPTPPLNIIPITPPATTPVFFRVRTMP